MEEEETIPIKAQERTPITLTLSHDAAVAVAVAAIHFRAWSLHDAEMASSIEHLDQVYGLIVKQQHLSETSRAMLQDMRYHVAGMRDEPEGGSQHAATRTPA